MSKTAITNAVLGLPVRLGPEALPWVTYSDPDLAHAGLTREQIEASGKTFQVHRLPYAKLDRAVAQGEPDGQILLYASGGTILGVSAVGAHAGEIVAELGLAMQRNISLRQIFDSLHAYPTFALGARRAADQWYIQNTPGRLLRVLRRLRGLTGKVFGVESEDVAERGPGIPSRACQPA